MKEALRFCSQCGGSLEYKLLKAGEPHRHVCSSCDTIHFLGPKLAAGVLFQHNDQIVLARRAIEPGMGLWAYPGGFVERGETLEEAAKREAKEEVCAEIELEGLLGVYSYPASIIAVVMFCGKSLGDKPKVGDEVKEVGFFSKENIPWEELAFSSVKESLEDYLSGKVR